MSDLCQQVPEVRPRVEIRVGVREWDMNVTDLLGLADPVRPIHGLQIHLYVWGWGWG